MRQYYHLGVSGVIPTMCKKCRKKQIAERMKELRRLRAAAVKINYFPDQGCIHFDELCGGCIMPAHPCNMFKAVV